MMSQLFKAVPKFCTTNHVVILRVRIGHRLFAVQKLHSLRCAAFLAIFTKERLVIILNLLPQPRHCNLWKEQGQIS